MYSSKLDQSIANPAGDTMGELNDLELGELAGAFSSRNICTAITESTYLTAICCSN
ncbi:hypothetical protein [Clostridium saccharobutylicum]|uniref:Lantibiotic n=1 Tax=Clostridium saccharobutylicum DSM 13864 TaxID=1345695 RepID=U5MQD3_CLOSA|nr:hypothetical protein [Clostridium saccharobutylicum]AGX41642.1 hypothetical protein CLSA_c06290 [Clostridium saccharobutylicum DSM 13864]MBA2904074.1 hypothetical protein [Clostridium saccharobutylicum]MBA8788567.1 hypothetical protein [Clostridium saccharobutylicum]MBA8895342.1 hypothetical protein [Clostridium saccharobutylicum]MBA8982235.1 hypothetical protein [Clostridium saccharobutylicum]